MLLKFLSRLIAAAVILAVVGYALLVVAPFIVLAFDYQGLVAAHVFVPSWYSAAGILVLIYGVLLVWWLGVQAIRQLWPASEAFTFKGVLAALWQGGMIALSGFVTVLCYLILFLADGAQLSLLAVQTFGLVLAGWQFFLIWNWYQRKDWQLLVSALPILNVLVLMGIVIWLSRVQAAIEWPGLELVPFAGSISLMLGSGAWLYLTTSHSAAKRRYHPEQSSKQ